jgi:hypothetical protein
MVLHTFFADETVVTVVRVVGIAQTPVRVLELEELVAVLARVSCAEKEGFNVGIVRCTWQLRVRKLTSICKSISIASQYKFEATYRR